MTSRTSPENRHSGGHVPHDVDSPVEPPLLRVVRGDPTPEELAALVAVVTARRGSAEPPPRRRPAWGRPAAAMRRPHRAGAGAWRASSLPH
ncbi:MAG: acyl-CoA carboxylase subunit epsilon [Nocardioidaceae bacterium]